MIKKIVFAAFMSTIVLFACSAGGKSEAAPAETPVVSGSGAAQGNDADPELSFSFGLVLGGQIKETGLTFNYDEFVKGFRDAVEGAAPPRITLEDAMAQIQAAFELVEERQAEEGKQKEAAFLEENGKKSGVVTTASGLQYEVITEGRGRRPGADALVEVNYEGSLIDGTVFDSSFDRGESAEIPLNQVIPGWTEGIQLMTIGSTYRFFIPSALGYGGEGAGGVIPPYSTLIFRVEGVSIVEEVFLRKLISKGLSFFGTAPRRSFLFKNSSPDNPGE
jgi:FKBP-type peptidyl-prolyl cis-trans isomerase